MTTESYARPPTDAPDLTARRVAIERQFRHAATLGTEAADLDVAGYWLRDADAAMPDPHYAARLLRAVMTQPTGDAYRIACDWLRAAALSFAQDAEARAAEAGALYEPHETPVECCEAIRRAP